MYTTTIIFSIFFLVVIAGFVIMYIKEKEGVCLFCAILMAFIGMMVIGRVYTDESREINHPYDKVYTIKLYYLDGGHTINNFKVKSWEEPLLAPGHGGCVFKLGGHHIKCVTRYEIMRVEKQYWNKTP
jgi:hypothetical protein